MATLRFHLPKLARRTPPSGDAGTSAPTEYPSSSVGALPFVEGDGPQESGVTPSPSIDTDRLNKLLIEAAAVMREQNDRLAAVNAALDQLEDDYARRKHGGVAQGIAISSINRAMGR